MRIVAVSDTHGHLPQVPECDVLVLGGDLTPVTDHRVEYQRRWCETTFSEWLREVPAKKIIGIGGNHDFCLEDEEFARSLPWIYLLNEPVLIEGVLFWGSPFSPQFGPWAFMKPDDELEEIWREIPFQADVAVIHGPPYGSCDFTCPRYGSRNAGSKSLRARLLDAKPRLLICGHIHEGYGWDKIGRTTICNVSYVDENYAIRYERLRTLDVNGSVITEV